MTKKSKISILIAFIVTLTVFCGCFDDSPRKSKKTELFPELSSDSSSEEDLSSEDTVQVGAFQNSKKTKIIGNGKDIFTIMIYICASDLESEYGAATNDIIEMCSAGSSEKVNIILQTGGALEWQNSVISNESVQRYQIVDEELVLLDDIGQQDMTDPDTLSDFITYCSDNYDANRNALILWNHGGGAVGGYGYDENYESDAMQLDEINYALDSAGTSFDFIGFDACLMATIETALMLSAHADYLIASEELEPGYGWFYTNWINEIVEDSSIDTIEIGERIIDDFVQICYEEDPEADTTLSIIDLTEMGDVYTVLCEFMNSANFEIMNNNNFAYISKKRKNTKDFGGEDLDTVDLIHLAENFDIEESDNLISALNNCIKYKNNSKSVSDANGLTIYFPYNDMSQFQTILSVYENIGIGDEYDTFLRNFANILAGGQGNLEENSIFDSLSDDDYDYSADYSEWDDFGWFDSDFADDSSEYYDDYYFDSDELEVIEKYDEFDEPYYALSLSDEDWESIVEVECQLMYDDGEGYIDLGSDNFYTFDDDGDLMITFDNYWIALDGLCVPYWLTESNENYTEGVVCATINDTFGEIVIRFDESNNWEGAVLGVRYEYENGVQQKGITELQTGDVIQVYCDYYTYDGDYVDYYPYGDELIVDGELAFSYEDVGEGDCLIYYMLTDIFQNYYWTEPVTFCS